MEENSFSQQCVDDFILPGFRFHPTDEELVEFYLKMKLENRALPIELIKAVDIYKYDPWELPKLNSSSAETEKEKEWYFYCPRDRKYRNSTRPNRVTGSGFWKATGTDRPIYSSGGGSKCVGLKKSLVFYRGRAAKGFKTDWMMHEFRLPSDKSFPLTDSWAICRIFKKTNSTANRDLSHNWTQTTSWDVFAYFPGNPVFSEASGTSDNHPTSTFFNQPLPANNNLEATSHHLHHHYQANYSFDSSQVIQATIDGETLDQWRGFPFSSPPCPSQMSSTTFGL